MKSLRTSMLALWVIAAFEGVSPAQPVSPSLTPEQLEAAIAWGKTGNPKPYPMKIQPGEIGVAFTPFLRVAIAARKAADQYKPFTAGDVPKEWLEQYVWLQIWSHPAMGKRGMVEPVSVIAMPNGSKDPSTAIQPVQIKETSTDFQNMYGAQFEYKGLLAAFPLSLLSREYEFVIVYNRDKWTFMGKPEQRIVGICDWRPERCVRADEQDPQTPRYKKR